MTLGRTSFFHFSTQILTSVAGFLATFVIARYLGAGVLGTFVQATALVVVLNIPMKTIGGSASKRVSERRHPEEYMTAGLILLSGAIGVISLVMWVGKPIVTAYLGAPVAGLVVLYLASNALFSFYTSLLTGEKKVVASGGLNAVEQGLRFIFQFGFILLGYSIAGLLFGQVLSLVAGVIVGVSVSALRFRRPGYHHFRRLWEFARYIWMAQIKGRSFTWMDVLILGALVENSLVGIYEVSWTLASFLLIVSLSVQQTLFPELSELGVKDDYDRVRHLLHEGLGFVGIFAIPGLFGALVIGSDVLAIYRPIFEQGTPVLLLLIVARLLDAYASQLISALSALDYPEFVFRVSAVFTVVNISLNFGLIWFFGWIGAAVATSIAAFIELLLSYYYLVGIIDELDIPIRTIVSELIAGSIMAVLITIATWYAPLTHYITVALVLFGATVYLVILIGLSVRIRRKALMLMGFKEG